MEALEIGDTSKFANSQYFLLELNPVEYRLRVRGYKLEELPKGMEDYLEAEKRLKDVAGGQAVLVAAESLQALRRAYPNYYLDSERFLTYFKNVVGS